MKECCSPNEHSHNHDHDHDHGHQDTSRPQWLQNWNLLFAFAILATLLVLEYGFQVIPGKPFNFLVNLVALLLAGWDVLKLAFRKISHGDIFNEFVLMSTATIGAFYIGEYAEGVAVMVFYAIGEWFQDAAVDRAKANIKALLDVRPDAVTLLKNGQHIGAAAADVKTGDTLIVKPGEKVGLDGVLLSDKGTFNTAALTGESRPDTIYKDKPVFAGMINQQAVVEIKVTAAFRDSKLSRILEMVQDATTRKSQTQLFISRFGKVYTPIVFFLALAITLVPWLFVQGYVFNDWLYRGLVFLVISCPCALVVSIPLGYFGGIGLASRNGILFKGGNFLDVMTALDTIVVDKTGTLTMGVFKVQEVHPEDISAEQLISLAVALEQHSTHPVARAVVAYADREQAKATNVEEHPGFGLSGTVNGQQALAGNTALLKKFNISYPVELDNIADTLVAIASGGRYAGYITIADELKPDASAAVKALQALKLKVVMLSGDKPAVVSKVAGQLGITSFFGGLLPEDKVAEVEKLKSQGHKIAFVGDGINDAPVLALADAGIAMGGLGSDAAIETADIVIQNDQPSKIATAIRIGKITRSIVWQNIVLAMAVKVIVLVLGAGGVANLWEAVIADVGVALLAILNAVRIQNKQVTV